ncbi:MAG: chemotaxis protein CheB [Pseudomonadota bacterium]
MHILIAHPSPIARARLDRALSAQENVHECTSVTSLSETYHLAEHTQPDAVVISAPLADCAEFELLKSLMDILQIVCVFLDDQAPTGTQGEKGVGRVPGDITAEALIALIAQLQKQQPAKPRAAKGFQQDAQFDTRRFILIGASTGGVDALINVVGGFPENCPPTFIVQHTGGSFADSLIRLLSTATEAKVVAAKDMEPTEPGHIYLAPGGQFHLGLRVVRRGRVRLVGNPPISGHRPSVDALFHSAVPAAEHVTAALLTGMGRDGADGLLALRNAGAHTIVQDEVTSVVYGMPRAAKMLGAASEELPISKISGALLRASQKRASA